MNILYRPISVKWLLIVCLLSVATARAQDDDGEKVVKMKNLPQAVQATVHEQSKGRAVGAISQEKRNGQTFYEVEIEADGRSREVLIDLAGKVIEVEEQVALDSLPAAVKAEIIKQAAPGRLVQVASVSKDDLIVAYEARVSLGRKVSEIRVAADGRYLGVEGADDDDKAAPRKKGRP